MNKTKWFTKIWSLFLALVMVAGMIPAFQIESNAATENYKGWGQIDTRWKNTPMGNQGGTIGQYGCLCVSITKLAIQCGLKDTSFTPDVLVKWLNSNKGFTNGANLVWSKIDDAIPGMKYDGIKKANGEYSSSNSTNQQQIINWIKSGYHLVLAVNGSGHWIAVDEEETLKTGKVHIMNSNSSDASKNLMELTKAYSTFNQVHAFKGGTTPSSLTPKCSATCYEPGSNIKVSWSSVSGASFYWVQVYRNSKEYINYVDVGNTTSYTLSQPSRGYYTFLVTAVNKNNVQLAQGKCSGTVFQPITAESSYTKGTDVTVQWQTVPTATKYVVQLWRDGEMIDDWIDCGTKLNYTIPSIKKGKNTAVVFVYNGDTRIYEAKVSFTGVESHTHSYTVKSTNSKYLKSAATCTSAAVYYYSCSCGEKGTKTFTSGSALGHSYDSGKVTKEATYDETGVRTYTCSRCGATKTKTIPKLLRDAPVLTEIKNTANGVKLTWEPVDGVDAYEIYRKTADGEWEPKYCVASTEYEICADEDEVSSGRKYTYTVACCDENGKLLSTYDKTGMSIYYLDPVMKEDLTLSNREGGIKVSWPKISGCTGYYVYRKDGSDGEYKKIATVKDKLYYTDTSVADKNGKSFYYRVKAYKGGSKAYGQGRCKIRLTQPTISSLTSPSAGKFTVKWNKNSKATGYQVRYSTSSDFSSYKTKTVESNTTVSKSVSSLTKGKKYYVKVRSYKVSSSGNKYYSSWSSAKSVTVK